MDKMDELIDKVGAYQRLAQRLAGDDVVLLQLRIARGFRNQF